MKDNYSRFVEILCIAVLTAVTVYVFIFWSKLPQTVPIHFDAAGNVDGYGSKASLLILLFVIYFFYGLLSLLQRFPQANNYLVAITQENKERQYALVSKMVLTMKLELIMIFTYLQYATIQGAYSKFALGGWFLPATLILVFGTLGVYLFNSVKAK